jgi:hypothetical protein
MRANLMPTTRVHDFFAGHLVSMHNARTRPTSPSFSWVCKWHYPRVITLIVVVGSSQRERERAIGKRLLCCIMLFRPHAVALLAVSFMLVSCQAHCPSLKMETM